MNLPFQLILASKSPRRKALLRDLGLDFDIRTADTDEGFPPEMPVDQVPVYLAEKKALAIPMRGNELIIASDTVVVSKGCVLGKPVSPSEAEWMLQELSGTSHEVISGVCLRTEQNIISFSEKTTVYFRALSVDEIRHYILNYQPFDKAGAYGIQEWIGMIGVEKIEGCYYNVVGFPVSRFYQTLKQLSQ